MSSCCYFTQWHQKFKGLFPRSFLMFFFYSDLNNSHETPNTITMRKIKMRVSSCCYFTQWHQKFKGLPPRSFLMFFFYSDLNNSHETPNTITMRKIKMRVSSCCYFTQSRQKFKGLFPRSFLMFFLQRLEQPSYVKFILQQKLRAILPVSSLPQLELSQLSQSPYMGFAIVTRLSERWPVCPWSNASLSIASTSTPLSRKHLKVCWCFPPWETIVTGCCTLGSHIQLHSYWCITIMSWLDQY